MWEAIPTNGGISLVVEFFESSSSISFCFFFLDTIYSPANKHSQEFNVGRREWTIYPECYLIYYYVYFIRKGIGKVSI